MGTRRVLCRIARVLMKLPILVLCLVIPSLLLLYYGTYKWEILPTQAPLKKQHLRLRSRQAKQGPLGAPHANSVESGVTVESEPLDVCLEGHLPATFKSALHMYPIVPIADVKIVLVVAYYRSGSTFLGELLSSGPASFFHFEPLQLFTGSGRIRWGRQGDAFELLNKLVMCRMQEVPLYMAWLEREQLYRRNQFMVGICQGGHSCSCPSQMTAVCQRSRTQVFKFTRLSVTQVAEWIESNPDIAKLFHVIHLVRDPRAIYASRQALKWCYKSPQCISAEVLCAQMRSDLDAFETLAGQMRQYRMHQLRFEDLAADPVSQASRLFDRLNLYFSPSVLEYIKAHTVARDWDLWDPYSTIRNTSQVAGGWKLKLQKDETKMVEEACADVLRRLGYQITLNNNVS